MRSTALFEMKPKELARWEKVRARGKRRFVLLWGVAAFGGLMFLFTAAADFPSEFSGMPFWFRLADFLTTFVIMGPLLGAVWGLLFWYCMEKRYLKHVRKAQRSTEAT